MNTTYKDKTKLIEITLRLTSDDTFDVEIYEPETGDFTRIECHDKGWETMKENTMIMQELRSWVESLREESTEE